MSYYQRSWFKHLGESKAQFGGGGWHDMVSLFLSTLDSSLESCLSRFRTHR